MRALLKTVAAALVIAAAANAGGVLMGGSPPVDGAAVAPSSVTTPFVDAGVLYAGFIATNGAPPGTAGTTPVVIGSRSSPNFAGIWFNNGPSAVTDSNYQIIGDGSQTLYLRAPQAGGAVYFVGGSTAGSYADATGFHTLDSKSETFGSWSGYTVGVVATNVNFLGCFKPTLAVAFRNITASWAVAGAGPSDGGAGQVVVRIRNITDSSTLCTCTLGACAATASTPLSCDCNSIATAGKTYCLQYDPTASTGTVCGTDPSGTFATVEMVQ